MGELRAVCWQPTGPKSPVGPSLGQQPTSLMGPVGPSLEVYVGNLHVFWILLGPVGPNWKVWRQPTGSIGLVGPSLGLYAGLQCLLETSSKSCGPVRPSVWGNHRVAWRQLTCLKLLDGV